MRCAEIILISNDIESELSVSQAGVNFGMSESDPATIHTFGDDIL